MPLYTVNYRQVKGQTIFYKIRNNESQILIGVRSAVFAPFTNLGLVIIDEEHDQSYKQEERPCYHAREVALHRAEYFDIPVVLGSATPSIESYYDAMMKRFKHLRLTGRPNGQPLPKVQIVDMRKELQERKIFRCCHALCSRSLCVLLRQESRQLCF